MSDSAKSSSVRVSTKPVNVFYVWYSELCRRLNSSPAPIVKPAKPKCKTVLDFVGDRLKFEEWSPVINALRHDTSLHVINIRSRIGNCQFLHDVDTEEKTRKLKRKYGMLWTAYILKNLLRSISCLVKNTQVLTCLELDGLPMFSQYLEPLLQALKKNNTVKTLSLSNCLIKDIGCDMICGYLRFTPNIEVLNLSGCALSSESGIQIAKLIKYQQINRYCESWHRSLRYENPDCNKMRGIKRITLNCNPMLGDAGLLFILKELEDDLWVKAIDVQKCGITEEVTDKVIELLEYSRSIEIIDLRQNEQIDILTLEKILQLFKQRELNGSEPEYQWCDTAVTLSFNSVGSYSSFSCVGNNIHKSTSLPVKPTVSSISYNKNIKKSKTTDNFKSNSVESEMGDVKKQIFQLNSKLEREISKRKATEKKNFELQKCLDDIKSASCLSNRGNFKTIISAIEKLKPVVSTVPMITHKSENTHEINGHVKKPNGVKNGHKLVCNFMPKELCLNDKITNGHSNNLTNCLRKVSEKEEEEEHVELRKRLFKNGIKKKNNLREDLKDKNGHCKNNSINHIYQNGHTASNIFETLIKSGSVIDDNDDDDEEEFLKHLKGLDHRKNGITKFNDILSSSQVSLYNFIEGLKASSSSKQKSRYKTNTNHPK